MTAMTDSPRFDKPAPFTLAVVGLGLIGGSFAAALREQGAVSRILGVTRQPETGQRAVALGLVDEIVDAPTAAARADMVMLATPVGGMAAVMASMRNHLRPAAVLTDAGSTKGNVIAAARAALGDRIGQFVPGHPIAGGERTGPDAAFATLYRDRQVLLTPLAENSPEHIERVRSAWLCCGARVATMSPEQHDAVLGAISHLPHLLASVYMDQIATAEDADVRLHHAGAGFRDVTRIAAGSAEMWRDIFLGNAAAVQLELDRLRARLDEASQALARGDGEALYDMLERAALARRAWPAVPVSSPSARSEPSPVPSPANSFASPPAQANR